MRLRALLILLVLVPMLSFAQAVHIGDILCTDGSIISREAFPSSGRTAEGIVFYVNTSDSEGWAVSLNNQSNDIKWCSDDKYGYNVPDLDNYSDARVAMHDLNGLENTGIIRNSGSSSDFPAAWAVDYDNGWYLPSGGQLRYLYSYAPEINASLQVAGGTSLPYHDNNYWWSSTEHSDFHAFDMNTGGSLGDYVKNNYSNYPPSGIGVRQIRNFTIPNPVHPTYHIGDLITNDDGSQGILFYVTPDQTDGWMVALNDASTSVAWGNGDVSGLANQTCSTPYGNLLNETDGFANTGTIRTQQAGLNTAANTVDYEHGWYLPTAGQLSKLFGAFPFIESQLQTYGTTLSEAEYWSSSEADGGNAFSLSCANSGNVRSGHFARRDKTSNYRVREVRNLSFTNPPLPDPSLPDNVIESDCNQPLEGSPWNIQMLHSSADNDIASYSPIVAGDIDANGIIDIVVARYTDNAYHSNGIYVFSGDDLHVQTIINIPDTLYNYNGYAIGRYPLDNGEMQGAIFVHTYDKRIRAFSVDGTLLRVSDRPTSCDGMLSLADFNGDGHPEIYSGSDIFDAATLKWLCSGPANGNKGLGFRGPPLQTAVNTHHTYYAMSLAYNVLGDARQELICGNTIYNVNIVSRTNPAQNSVTVNKTITPPSGFSQDGHALVADFDLDGESEVIVLRDDTDDHTNGYIYIYAYKPNSGQILFQKAHHAYCTSYPFVGSIDEDPYPEIVLLEKQLYSTAYLYCWRYTPSDGLTTVWQQEHNDSSGQTGLTLFDFNQDGIMELVYRDNQNLRILNGSGKSHITGNDTIRPYDLYSRRMSAGTGVEYPIVVDVNGDGFAEIVATGLLNSTQEVGYGGIFIFGSPGNWSPARPVWNQYMYHVTNVNEDLTIPTFCFDKATVFTGHDGTIRRPFNNFLQQAYYITPEGEPYNPGGSIEVAIQGSGCNSFTFHGVTYDESGHYEQLVETPEGCDTLYLIEVELGQPVTSHFWKTRCASYTWNDITYYETGNYQQTFEGANGCDSIVTLHLTISDTITREFERTRCKHYSWNGITYTESGDYIQEFITPEGCDSIVTLHLTITGPVYDEWSYQTCDDFVWNGITYTEPGDYVQELVTPQGCDSIVTLHLVIADTLFYDWEAQNCTDYSWNGITYDESGFYPQFFVSTHGCDSMSMLHLTIYEPYETDLDTLACGSLLWNGQMLTEPGEYPTVFQDANGCDSLVRLQLAIDPYPAPIPTIEGLTEVYVCTDLLSGHYQYHIDSVVFASRYEWELVGADWPMDTTGLDCQLWVITQGTVTLKAKAWNECGMTEQEIEIHAGFYDLKDLTAFPVALYPNPSSDKAFIVAEGIKCVKIYNMQGRLVKELDGGTTDSIEVGLQDLPQSLYTVEVLTGRGKARLKLSVTH